MNHHPNSLVALQAHNAQQHSAATEVMVARAQKALAVLKEAEPFYRKRNGRPERTPLHTTYAAVLRTRVQHPDATLSECAAVMRMSRDTYASRLRRAIAYAEKRSC